VRERLEAHREQPSCNACHDIMDPLGFALENFDATGPWRTNDRFAPEAIDAPGGARDGTVSEAHDDPRRRSNGFLPYLESMARAQLITATKWAIIRARIDAPKHRVGRCKARYMHSTFSTRIVPTPVMTTFLAIAALVIAFPLVAEAQTVLITGANSGIGLEFAKQYAAKDWTVIATHRRDEIPETLMELIQRYPKVRAERMDVTSREEVYGLAEKLADVPIDVLINNAGLFLLGDDWHENARSRGQSFGSFDWDQFDQFVATNIRGPMMVTEAFVEHVKASDQKKIVNISSENGQITGKPLCCGLYWYRMTKAALNKLMRQLSVELMPDEVIVVLFNPGAVRVEKQENFDFPGMVETDFTVRNMIDTTAQLRLMDTGRFLFYDGTDWPL
jgi:NAD(P)-dependent dehydrogenase (short-subunit alcohol dehydrogenase family)